METRTERLDRQTAAQQAAVAKLENTPLAARLKELPPLPQPTMPGSLHREARNSVSYFIPLGDFRSGRPLVGPAQRTEQLEYRLQAGVGERAYWQGELVERVKPGKVEGFIPMMAEFGLLCTVCWVWDLTKTRQVEYKYTLNVDGGKKEFTQLEERKGCWCIRYSYTPKQTPLAKHVLRKTTSLIR